MYNIVAYFIGYQGYIQTILLTFRYIIEAYKDNKITKIIVKVVLEFRFNKQLNIYVSNNTNLNDTIQKIILSILYLDCDLKASYSYYLSYIINLAIKAFIFNKNIAIFKTIIDVINDTTPQNSSIMRAI